LIKKNTYLLKKVSSRKISLLFVFWLLVVVLRAQVNHVLNPSFEYVSNCGDPLGSFISLATPWDTLKNGGGNGYPLNKCFPINSNSSTPFNLYGNGYQYPRTGDGYAYLNFFKLTPNPAVNWRWYIQQKMAKKLIANKSYCVTYWVSLINYCNYGVDELAAYFDDGSIQSIAWSKEAPANPQVKSPSNVFYIDTLNWMKVQGSFIATGNEEYITLGNFRLNAVVNYTSLNGATSGNASYFVDDVSVIETDLPADAGVDKYCAVGDSVFIGRTPEIGLNDACMWYKLPNITNAIDTVAGLWVKPVVTSTYVVKQNICGMVKWDTVIVNKTAIGLNEYDKLQSLINVFPNPAQNFIHITNTTELTFTHIRIYNQLGQLLKVERLKWENKIALVNTEALENGVYSVQLQSMDIKNAPMLRKQIVITH
jgi:hypothetical protein